jgi:hypothetical protein
MARQRPQFIVQQRDEAIEGIVVPFARSIQKALYERDVKRFRCSRHMSLHIDRAYRAFAPCRAPGEPYVMSECRVEGRYLVPGSSGHIDHLRPADEPDARRRSEAHHFTPAEGKRGAGDVDRRTVQ